MAKSNRKKPPIKQQKASIRKILKAIEGTGGLKTAIATKLGVHPHTVLNYEKKYETVRQAIEDERNKILDKAESNIFVRIQEGDEDTSKWFLARKGKGRGYSEKMDIDQKTEHTGELDIKVTNLEDTIKKYKDALRELE